VHRALSRELDQAQVTRELPHALSRYLALYAGVNGESSAVYPGVREGLAQCRARGWPLACVTNKPRELSVGLLPRPGLINEFALVVGGDSQPEKKPHPEPLLAACRALGVLPEQAVMVGDSENDAQAARAAGSFVVLVPYGYQHGTPLREVPADGIVDSLHAAVKWMDDYNQRVQASPT
jgi:phosphoglycolate phosphatase